jgi:hypothetical protein
LVVALPNVAGGVKLCAHLKVTRINKKPAEMRAFLLGAKNVGRLGQQD